ncbi:MAG: hypothetical protein A2W04_10950 [Betaproteobacteria bacterium RBG_16_64_9]|nr:MAG: hypothetical protein A2W04_10950 [Betaproteobacteria bacterium RBG_16_64_9]
MGRVACGILVGLALVVFLSPQAVALTESRTVMLLPTADSSPQQWTGSGCAAPSLYACLDEDPPHDNNLTYHTANPGAGLQVFGYFHLADLPTDVLSVESVTFFAWALEEATGASLFSAGMQLPTCDTLFAPLTDLAVRYANVTSTSVVDCGGNPWTVNSANAVTLILRCADDGIAGAEQNCRVTSAGAVVSYTIETGIYTASEYDFRLLLLVWVIFLVIGLALRSSFFLFLAGVAGTFFAFSAFAVTESLWTLVLFVLLGPFLFVAAAMLALQRGEGWAA